MLAYAGRYKTEGDKLIIYPEIDARQTFIGMELVRFFGSMVIVCNIRRSHM